MAPLAVYSDPPVGSREAARSARICETHLLYQPGAAKP